MATPTDVRIAIPATRGVKAGTFVGGRLAGAPGLDSLVAAGTVASAPSALSGSLGLTDIEAAGAFGGLPAWLAGAALNQWAAISGTASPTNLADYSGVAIRDEPGLTEVFVGAAGGHSSAAYTLNNSVYTINLHADAPAWVQRTTPSNTAGFSSATMAIFPSDGRPAPRHLYQDVFWSPEVGKFIIGGRFLVNSDDARGTYFAWSPTTGEWTRLADRPVDGVIYSARDPVTGRIYSTQAYQYDPTSDTHSAWALTGAASVNRMVCCVDSARRRIFNLAFGDGWNDPTGALVACSISIPGGVKTAITFNSSAALTALLAETRSPWLLASVEHNPDLDVFYFYSGGSGTKSIYVITPNTGTAWDVTTLTAGGVTPPDVTGTALNKLRYVSKYKALLLFLASQNIHYLRTQ